MIEPLTAQQIDNYLSSVGGKLEAVRVALHRDPVLQELATTPLILTLAYHGKPVEDLVIKGSLETLRWQIFATYVQRTLQRRGTEIRYSPQQTMRWLTCLAQQMRKHSQTEFYIEWMQPDWLSNDQLNRFYYSMAGRLSFGLVGGLTIGLIYSLLFNLVEGLIGGLVGGLICGLTGGLIVGVGVGSSTEIKLTEVVVWSWESVWRDFVDERNVWLSVGLIGGLSNLLSIMLGLIFGLPAGLLYMLIFGLVVGLLAELVIELNGGLKIGLSTEKLDESNLVTPNQGLRRSAHNSLFSGLVFGVAVGLLIGLHVSLPLGFLIVLLTGLDFGLEFGLASGLAFGLGFGLGVALINGGAACIRHLLLRIFFWYARVTPLKYSRFLDYSAGCILLRKVGGGYIFAHGLLLDYFASLDTRTIPDEGTTQTQDASLAL